MLRLTNVAYKIKCRLALKGGIFFIIFSSLLLLLHTTTCCCCSTPQPAAAPHAYNFSSLLIIFAVAAHHPRCSCHLHHFICCCWIDIYITILGIYLLHFDHGNKCSNSFPRRFYRYSCSSAHCITPDIGCNSTNHYYTTSSFSPCLCEAISGHFRIEVFSGQNYKRWQEQIYSILDMHGVAWLLTTENALPNSEQWTYANKVCRHTILTTLSNELFDVYCAYKEAKTTEFNAKKIHGRGYGQIEICCGKLLQMGDGRQQRHKTRNQ